MLQWVLFSGTLRLIQFVCIFIYTLIICRNSILLRFANGGVNGRQNLVRGLVNCFGLILVSQRVAAPPVAAMREVLGPADPLKDLAEVLTPRTTSANSDEFGRSRRVGYVTVLPGQDKAEQIALAKKKPPAASDLSLHKLFKSFSESRGETEGKFIEETFKVRQSFVFLLNLL